MKQPVSKKINYIKEAKKFRPKKIKILLVGEAPPHSGKSYFYTPPRSINSNKPIRSDSSLPATIFYHYFRKRPKTIKEYINLLRKLQRKGIFLIDIVDEPIRVRGKQSGLQRVKKEIKNLRKKIKTRKIKIKDENIIFLLARRNYKANLKKEFPEAKRIQWIDFRTNSEKSK